MNIKIKYLFCDIINMNSFINFIKYIFKNYEILYDNCQIVINDINLSLEYLQKVCKYLSFYINNYTLYHNGLIINDNDAVLDTNALSNAVNSYKSPICLGQFGKLSNLKCLQKSNINLNSSQKYDILINKLNKMEIHDYKINDKDLYKLIKSNLKNNIVTSFKLKRIYNVINTEFADINKFINYMNDYYLFMENINFDKIDSEFNYYVYSKNEYKIKQIEIKTIKLSLYSQYNNIIININLLKLIKIIRSINKNYLNNYELLPIDEQKKIYNKLDVSVQRMIEYKDVSTTPSFSFKDEAKFLHIISPKHYFTNVFKDKSEEVETIFKNILHCIRNNLQFKEKFICLYSKYKYHCDILLYLKDYLDHTCYGSYCSYVLNSRKDSLIIKSSHKIIILHVEVKLLNKLMKLLLNLNDKLDDKLIIIDTYYVNSKDKFDKFRKEYKNIKFIEYYHTIKKIPRRETIIKYLLYK